MRHLTGYTPSRSVVYYEGRGGMEARYSEELENTQSVDRETAKCRSLMFLA
jgi:hypothetical protein